MKLAGFTVSKERKAHAHAPRREKGICKMRFARRKIISSCHNCTIYRSVFNVKDVYVIIG